MHKYICHSIVSFTYVTQPYRIVLKRECTAYNAFPIDLVIGTSRNRFATDSLEMGDRCDIVKILDTCGLQQIKPPTAKVRVSYYKMSAG